MDNNLTLSHIEQTTYYDTTKMQIKSKYVISPINNKLHGPYVEYYQSKGKYKGQVKLICNYKHGIPHDKFKRFSEQGLPQEEGFYINGKLNGIYKKYNDVGILQTQVDFVNNKQHGFQTDYNEKGIILYVTKYVDDIQKQQTDFYSNGKEKAVFNYKCENIKHGEVKGFYPNGIIKIIYNNEDNYRHGKYIMNYKDGSKYLETNYIKDNIDGPLILYYKNGNIKKKMMFVDGKIEGEIIKYYDTTSNVIKYIRHYKNNKPHGECIDYNIDGCILMKHNYVNGEIDGECIEYEDGKIKEITNYLN